MSDHNNSDSEMIKVLHVLRQAELAGCFDPSSPRYDSKWHAHVLATAKEMKELEKARS